MIVKIYVLIDPRNDQVRYVGKTVQPLKQRLDAHLRNSVEKKTHRDCWIAGLAAAGLRPVIESIEAVASGADWQSRERHWIIALRQQGCDLTNIAAGGEGLDPTVAAATWTDGRRALQSLRTAEMNRARKGTPWSEERKRQQSEAQKRRWSNPEHRAAARLRMSQVCAAPEYRQKQSCAVAASWSDERRARQSAVAQKVNAAPGKREQQAALAARLRADAGKFMRLSK